MISHKTETSQLDPGVRLRDWATRWLADSGLGIPPGNVRFEATQEAKLDAISELRCDLFIDDLPALLLRPDFPRNVLPILFAPQGAPTGEVLSFSSWSELQSFVGYCAHPGPPPRGARKLEHDGNSRLFRLTSADGAHRILKRYPAPSRDFAVCQLLWERGFRDVPQPLWQDARGRFAAYGDVEGERPRRATPALVDQAVGFVGRLQTLPGLSALDVAVDGRLRLQDYPDTLRRRRAGIERDPTGREFFAREVQSLWDQAMTRFEAAAASGGFSLDAPLSSRERILSPSDFGLHNMLVATGREPVFLDFEYFGWDDPAKLVADFFHSVAHEVDWPLKWRFLDGVAGLLPDPGAFKRRWELVVDLIGLEWVLIVLNVFDPEKMARKKSANPGIVEQELLRERTKKARDLLQGFTARSGGFLTIPDRMENP